VAPLGKRLTVANNVAAMLDAPLLLAHNLTRYYHGRRVLHGIDLELHRGDVLGFLGPNGAGKSTTMNILSGVLAPHEGSVSICGHDLSQQPLQAKRHIGYLPETPPLHLDATVDEYLLFCARLRGITSAAASAAVGDSKRECDLVAVGSRLIGNLSKGFRQRVGIAQALLHAPAVVILDEPTSGLDPNQIRSVRSTIKALTQRHAVILSTHVLSEAQALCSRVAILHHGHIAFNKRVDQTQHAMRIQLDGLSSDPDWSLIAGITSGESLGEGHYLLQVVDFDVAANSLTRQAVAQNWTLRELRRDTSPLEQVFVNLTCNDGADFA
jgi:ABC-2 type transport system ATP-binding protein